MTQIVYVSFEDKYLLMLLIYYQYAIFMYKCTIFICCSVEKNTLNDYKSLLNG